MINQIVFSIITLIVVLVLIDLTNFLATKNKRERNFLNYILSNKWKIVIWLVGLGGLIGSILWSFLFNTFLPSISKGNTASILFTLFGFITILSGIAAMSYGTGTIFRDLRHSLSLMLTISQLKHYNTTPLRRLLTILHVLKHGLLIVVIGLITAIVGGLIGSRLGNF